MDMYWGLSADQWRTLSIVIQGMLMFILTGIGVIQIIALYRSSYETKRTRTIQICRDDETSSVLFECSRRISEAVVNGDLEKNPSKYKIEINQVLNHLDSVAIGIAQGIYDEKMAHQYLKWIIKLRVKRFLTDDGPEKYDLSIQAYETLVALDNRWGDPAQPKKKRFLSS